MLRTPALIEWSKSDLATNSYGQGLSMTPLQVLAAANAIANDGVLMQPYIVRCGRGADGELVLAKRCRYSAPSLLKQREPCGH